MWILNEGKAEFKAIKTGLLGEMKVEVTQGLQGGEKVVTGPQRILRDLKGGEKLREEKKPARDDAKKG